MDITPNGADNVGEHTTDFCDRSQDKQKKPQSWLFCTDNQSLEEAFD
jgi:hypothetical protein